MKFKYFLRGLGVGIIFASIVCLTAYWGNPAAKMSDDEIIRRAKKLGMVEKEDNLGGLLNNTTQEINKADTTSSESATKDTDASTQADTTSEDKNTESVSEDSSKTEEIATNKKTEETTEQNDKTEVAKEKQSDDKKDTVKITIQKGSSSFPVCQRLQELGMIEDAADFDTYLVENGYASRIRVGEHTLKKGMSYHDIAEAISDPL